MGGNAFHGLKLSTGSAGSGAFWEGKPGSVTACVMPKATWHEVQSNVQMAGTCAGLVGAQVRPVVNQGQLQLMPMPRAM